jgi:hypothetical protein
MVKLFTAVLDGNTGALVELTIVTLSVEEGIPFGLQLVFVFQLDEAAVASHE